MANSDKNLIITPNIGSTTDDPKIVFSGADTSTSAQDITLRAYPTNNGTLSIEGSAGQLFSVTNSLTGTLFSVNDISGIPSIEVIDDGTVSLAEYGGNVGIGTSSPYSQLDVYSTIAQPTLGEATGVGSIRITNGSSALSSNGGLEFKIAGDANGYGSKIQALNSAGSQLVFANRNASATWIEHMRITSAGNVGIGTSSPTEKLDVNGTVKATSFSGDGSNLTGIQAGVSTGKAIAMAIVFG